MLSWRMQIGRAEVFCVLEFDVVGICVRGSGEGGFLI